LLLFRTANLHQVSSLRPLPFPPYAHFPEHELEELRNCTSANYTNSDRLVSLENQDTTEKIDPGNNSSVEMTDAPPTEPFPSDPAADLEGQGATRSIKVTKPFQTGILQATFEMRRYPSVEVRMKTFSLPSLPC
jgi:hypothetical protein